MYTSDDKKEIQIWIIHTLKRRDAAAERGNVFRSCKSVISQDMLMHKCGLSRWRRQMTQRADCVFLAISRSGAVFFTHKQSCFHETNAPRSGAGSGAPRPSVSFADCFARHAVGQKKGGERWEAAMERVNRNSVRKWEEVKCLVWNTRKTLCPRLFVNRIKILSHCREIFFFFFFFCHASIFDCS